MKSTYPAVEGNNRHEKCALLLPKPKEWQEVVTLLQCGAKSPCRITRVKYYVRCLNDELIAPDIQYHNIYIVLLIIFVWNG